ncbi:hypothetical protein Y032_0706g1691 [Ancylostoma ceylanicum]|uniref:C2HC/C3H-type domain-containing protein n=2 Tax=Ancylostoma ceylanicum TaxID=53326 RepID=A0A016WHZ6_9BILA|nr:hypothetical protein Y032_0706g1691 [Ancylostoma ceylanicum]
MDCSCGAVLKMEKKRRDLYSSPMVKHEPVCKKLSKLTRKPFDSGKQRATGSDITYADVARAAKEREKLGGVYPRPLTNWKERHETFIDAVSSSKKVDYAIKTGAPLPPPPRTAVPSDYVQCNYCGRNFSEKAAERHIPFCKEQNARKVTSSSTRSLSGHRKTPVSNEVRNDTFEGTSQRRMRGTSRSPNKDDSQKRRKFVLNALNLCIFLLRGSERANESTNAKNRRSPVGFLLRPVLSELGRSYKFRKYWFHGSELLPAIVLPGIHPAEVIAWIHGRSHRVSSSPHSASPAFTPSVGWV